jgi:hypothetical protein
MNETTMLGDIIRLARIDFIQVIATEAAGLFWIFAECLILIWVRAGRKTLAKSNRVEFNVDKYKLVVGTLIFLIISTAILSRHFMGRPYHEQLSIILSANGSDQLQNLQTAVNARLASQRTHFALWASFVTIWVLLESAIVYNGWRGYQNLRALLRNPSPESSGTSTATIMGLAALLSVFMWGAANAAAPIPDEALRLLIDVRTANMIPQNALYLYLRIAGVIWISVEWIAAIILWKSYRLIACAVRRRNAEP